MDRNQAVIDQSDSIINLQIELVKKFYGKEDFVLQNSQGIQLDYSIQQDKLGKDQAKIQQTQPRMRKVLKQKKKINKQRQNKFKQKHVKKMPEKLDDLLYFKNELSEKQREKLQSLYLNWIPSEKLDQIIQGAQQSVSESESSSSGSYIFVKKSQFKKFNQSFLYEKIRSRILQKTSTDLKEQILARSKQQ